VYAIKYIANADTDEPHNRSDFLISLIRPTVARRPLRSFP